MIALAMGYGWEGKLTRLVPLDEEKHFENYLRWLNDPEVTEWLLVGDLPLTRLAEREWFDRASRNSGDDIVFAIETLDGRHLGSSGVHQIDHRHGVALTGSFIGDKELWGQGYGGDAARVRARYCFEVLGLRLIHTAYLEGNERSRRMSESLGFREYGRFPKRYWKRGQYRDEILLALDRETWLANARA
jgi:RimJ/RimL family protein N-acetyltransferase